MKKEQISTSKHNKVLKSVLTSASILALALSACTHEKEEAEEPVNSRGVPMSIANVIMGDIYSIDTLYTSDAATYIYIDNPEYTQHLIYGPEGLIVNSPTISLDSIGPYRYTVNNVLRTVDVDFSKPESVRTLKDAFPVYPEFRTIAQSDTSKTGQKAIFAIVADDPTSQVPDSSKVRAWVEKALDDTLAFNNNIKDLMTTLEKAFLNEYPKEESEFTYTYSRSMLAYLMTDNYVTYQDYFYVYRGGAHGMYGNRYITYDLKHQEPVTLETLFKPDTEDQLRELIYEAIAMDDDYMQQHKLTSLSQVKSYINGYLDGDPLPISDPGLLPTGVVFCYQPYEIGPYSDGTLQPIIPYSKLASIMK